MEQNNNPLRKVNNVDQSVREYIKKYGLFFLLLVIFFCCGLLKQSLQLLSISFSLFVLGIIALYVMAQGQFMRQVAVALGYKYSGQGDMKTVNGELFKIGCSQSIFNVMSGFYNDLPLRIYNYQTSVGSGKSRQNYTYTVFEITYPYNLPHVLLISKEGFLSDTDPGNPKIPKGIEIKLEGDFYKYFDLYTENDFELEVFRIFTPDNMVQLIDKGRGLNFEFCDNKLYIFQHIIISTKEKIAAVYEAVTAFSDMLTPHLEEISDDVEAMENAIKGSKT